MSEEETELISSTTGLTIGALPIRYLGVPLSTKKLSFTNCEPLIHQVKSKITTWSARSLSYAGRLLLINTVVAGITNFWCSTFVLPKSCIKKINSLCSAFLWSGSADSHHSARVAWDTITSPKEHGGLGIRDLYLWNKACILRLVWLLFFRSGSIWVAWYKEEVLHGVLNNYWTIQNRRNYSWLANKILKVKEEAFSFIKLRVKSGNTCRFWSDNWSPFGRLSTFLTTTRSSRLGIPLNSLLSDLFVQGCWLLPPARSENQVALQAYLSEIVLTNEPDYYEWEIDGIMYNRFRTGSVYSHLLTPGPLVLWDKMVWTKGGIPRHNFLCWLFILNRCPTKDRILGWGLSTDPLCPLCGSAPETRDHLLFDCNYSWLLWSRIAARCQFQPHRSWIASCQALQLLPLRADSTRLLLLAWQCSIYTIWTERNHRLHRQAYRSIDSLISQIDSTIRNKISSFREDSPSKASRLMQRWLSTS